MSRLLALAAGLLLAPSAVHAQAAPSPSAGASDPKAIALLARMSETYAGLKSYSATETATGPANMGLPYTLTLTYARPNRVNLTVTRGPSDRPETVHFVSDGTSYFTAHSQSPARYLKTEPPARTSVLEDAMYRSDLSFLKTPMSVILLEPGQNWFKQVKNDKMITFRLGTPGTRDGVVVDTVLEEIMTPDHHWRSVFEIGHADYLLRRFESTDATKGQPPVPSAEALTDIRANPALSASAFTFVPPPGAVAVTPTATPKADPNAVAQMAQMYAAYNALRSFSCAASIDAVIPTQDAKGKPQGTLRQHSTATYLLEKPNRISFTRTSQSGTTSAVCNGHILYAQTSETAGGSKQWETRPQEWKARPRYLKKTAPEGTSWNDTLALARFGFLPEYRSQDTRDWIPEIALGIDFMPADGGYGWQRGAPAALNGDLMNVITYARSAVDESGLPSSQGMLTLWISPKDHLLRQVQRVWIHPYGTATTTETYTQIKVNPTLPAATFAWTPPANGLAVDTPEALIPPQPAIGPTLHVGDAPPPAVFGVFDVDGHLVTATDYKGKVLVLDFWATWCGPCLQQIPSTEASYTKNHARGLEIVGYAFEQVKDKDKMPTFAHAHGMAWREVWDKDGVVGNAVAATGIPFAVVVGRDGKIAAVGNLGDDSLNLPAAIEAALAKP